MRIRPGQPDRVGGARGVLAEFARRFARSAQGNVAMMFAIALPVLVMVTMGGIDISRASTVKASLQDALDSATLAAARSSATTNEEINAIGNRVLRANLQHFADASLYSATFTLDASQTVVATATVNVKTLVAGIVLPSTGRLLNEQIPVRAGSEVTRSAKHLEVAMVLDITGSMDGDDIASLKTAAAGMVDAIVKDQQTPYTSRVAVIPYSMGVNLGAAAGKARGTVSEGLAVSSASKSCTSSWSSTSCVVTLTATNHGFSVGERFVLDGAPSASNSLNSTANTAYTVTERTANTLKFTISRDPSTTVTNARIHCVASGCGYFRFSNMAGGTSVQKISSCVTERTGGQAYTDASPSTYPVGRNYPMNGADNACPSSEIMPLSSDRTALKTRIDGLKAVGSTAGHIGTAWGWYALSPSFNTLWAGSAAANPYNTAETIKAVVLMTDGDFNTPYNSGVIAGDALTGSGANENKINQYATNGASASQAAQLCTAMKARGVIVYTVAFSVAANSPAATLLNGCASTADKAYVASSGTQLVSAFQAIGRDITQLRISR